MKNKLNKNLVVKLFILVVLMLCSTMLISCQKQNALEKNISELRQNYYIGKSENFSLTATSGFIEQPFINDGKVGETLPYLTFTLNNVENLNVTYLIEFTYNEQEYSNYFEKTPTTNKQSVTFNIKNFNTTSFNVNISVASIKEQVQLNSILTSENLNYINALSFFEKAQKTYLESLVDQNGNYKFELSLKLMLKNEKAYWYVGIMTGNKHIKALLLDGTTGDILAIREIFD